MRDLNVNEKLLLDGIIAEVDRATNKHPNWPKDKVYAATIVAEENGELTRACLQYESEGGNIEEIKTEAIHTAATCIRLLLNL
jgi:NTP pyrophosphatase (non-canonical NTP hydrolase)